MAPYEGPPAESDLHLSGEPNPCLYCGYDRRGLPSTRPCPECGSLDTGEPVSRSSASAIGASMPEGVACVKCGQPVPGLPLGAMCVHCATRLGGPVSGNVDLTMEDVPEGAPPQRLRKRAHLSEGELSFRITNSVTGSIAFRGSILALFCTLLGIVGVGLMSMLGMPNEQYFSYLAWMGTVAAIVAWPLTPRSLDIERPMYKVVRWGARIGLGLWAIGLWDLADNPAVRWDPVPFEAAGIVGAALLVSVGASIAREYELHASARRFTTSAFLTVPIGVYTWIMPFPEDRVVIPEGPAGFIAVFYVLITIGPWWWLLIRTARSLKDLLSETTWTIRARRDARTRDRALAARIQEPDSTDHPFE